MADGGGASVPTRSPSRRRPLEGKRILVTRPKDQARSLTGALEALGASVIAAPAIRIQPPDDFAPLDRAIRKLERFDWIVFTSVNGVRAFFERRRRARPDASLARVRFAAIGPATARALEAHDPSIAAEVVPERYVAEDVFRALKEADELSGKRILLPRADIAREALPRLLREAGAFVVVVCAYRTEPDAESIERAVRLAEKGGVDLVTFTSGSTVRSFFEVARSRSPKASFEFACASIGPITSAALRGLGLEPDVEAAEHTADGLVEAILHHYGSARS